MYFDTKENSSYTKIKSVAILPRRSLNFEMYLILEHGIQPHLLVFTICILLSLLSNLIVVFVILPQIHVKYNLLSHVVRTDYKAFLSLNLVQLIKSHSSNKASQT